jgi:hypothetical protein
MKLGRALLSAAGGFAKRGLQHNDEARKNLNDIVQKSVAVITTDAMEQRKAHKATKEEYKKTATALHSLGLRGAQIEAAYSNLGADAYTKLSEGLSGARTAWNVDAEKNGTDPWSDTKSAEWLTGKFKGYDPNAQVRTIEQQASAYANQMNPLTNPDFGSLAKGLGASSQEISFGGGKTRDARIASQMESMYAAGTGGIKPAGEDSPSFNPTGVSMDVIDDPNAMLEQRQALATTSSLESDAITKKVQSDNAEEIMGINIKKGNLANALSKVNYNQLLKTNPIQIELLEAQVGKGKAEETLIAARAGNADALAQLELSKGKLEKTALELGNQVKKLGLDQSKEKFWRTMEVLGLQIEGMNLDNIAKNIESATLEEMAGLNITLKQLQVEGQSLSNIAKIDSNSLHTLNKEKLQKSIKLIDAELINKATPKTYQAHLLQIEIGINQLDKTDPDYATKLQTLEDSKTAARAGLEFYQEATKPDPKDGSPKFPALVSSHGKALVNKMERAGFVAGKDYTFDDNDRVIWKGEPEAQAKFKAVQDRHNAQYYKAIGSFTQGPAALQALGIKAPDMYPTEEVEIGPPGQSGGFETKPVAANPSMVGKVYLMPNGLLAQITEPNEKGQYGTDYL